MWQAFLVMQRGWTCLLVQDLESKLCSRERLRMKQQKTTREREVKCRVFNLQIFWLSLEMLSKPFIFLGARHKSHISELFDEERTAKHSPDCFSFIPPLSVVSETSKERKKPQTSANLTPHCLSLEKKVKNYFSWSSEKKFFTVIKSAFKCWSYTWASFLIVLMWKHSRTN